MADHTVSTPVDTFMQSANQAAMKTALGLSKSDVGLSNVDNTADANKPVSTAQAAADAAVLAAAAADATTKANAAQSAAIAAAATDATSKANAAQAAAIGASQPLNANLTAEAGLTGAADRVSYYTGPGAKAIATLTSFGRSLIAAIDLAALKVILSLTKSDVGLGNVTNDAQLKAADLDTDPTLAANSNSKVPSQAAVKAYADALIAANDAMVFKGVVDCSANPNYPAADRGHVYKVSVAGKIGGASGPNVEAGDQLLCITDGTSSGNHATVGSAWCIIQTNIDGAVIGPASVTDGHLAQFDGTSGKLIKAGVALDTDGTLAANSDTRVATQKAVKTYADTKEPTQTAASQVEAEAGSETTIRSWSPVRVWQAIAAKLTLGTWIAGATAKTTPVDGDGLPISDSAASGVLKLLTFANLKSWVQAYLVSLVADGEYLKRSGSSIVGGTPSGGGGGGGADGWLPFAAPYGYDSSVNLDATSVILAANGGSVMIPIMVSAPMTLDAVKWRNRDTSGTRSVEFRFYKQGATNSGSGDNTLSEISGANGSESFTAAAASNRSVSLASPVQLSPGLYWFVMRNTDASNTYLLGGFAASGTALLGGWVKTKTIGSSLGSTLDFVTSWSASTGVSPGVVLLGRVFGQSTPYP